MSPGPAYSNLVELLQWRAYHQAEQEAYTFLLDGESEAVTLTYGELDRRARTIAAYLQSREASGRPVLVAHPPGLEFIVALFGCFYAGTIAVPTFPPRLRPQRPDQRFQTIAADSQANLILTTAEATSKIATPQSPQTPLLQWIATDHLPDELAGSWRSPSINQDSLAFLQYTSGSTTNPRGVMISHGNLWHNLAFIYNCMVNTADNRGVFWLPPYHDMGLLAGILQPLYCGSPVILLSPLDFIRQPVWWLQAISRYRATISGGPNFAYDLCIQQTTPEQRATLDLSSWQVAFNGAEPVRAETLEQFTATFTPAGFRRQAFYPCYGLAEATLLATGGHKTKPPLIQFVPPETLATKQPHTFSNGHLKGQAMVSCGRSSPDQTVLIVEPEARTLCPAGHIGEIWISGPSVAQGYWNQPQETQAVFQAYLATGEGPFLRSGDLGFIQNQELFVTGRLKDLIIIHGHNYYPQDIEFTVARSHPALQANGGAVFTIEQANETHLVVIQEVTRLALQRLDVAEVIQAIRHAVATEYQLKLDTVVLVKPGGVPKTTSGKIQHWLCRDKFIAETLPVVGQSSLHKSQPVAPTNGLPTTNNDRPVSLTQYLQTQAAQILNVEANSFNLHEPLMTMGFDSLMVARFVNRIKEDLGMDIAFEQLSEGVNMLQLVDYLQQQVKPDSSALPDSAPATVAPPPPETYRFDLFPEYRNLEQMLAEQAIDNPYFKAHQSVNNHQTLVAGKSLINFSSYNYLGMSGDPVVSAAAQAAIAQYGTSVSASRLISGEIPLHQELERELAHFMGVEAGLVYVSGHATNVTTVGHLFGPKDLILYDSLIHNSLMQGITLSGAAGHMFPHNDWAALAKILDDQRPRHRRVLIVVEGVYSMDGDIPHLPALIDLKERYGALLMVDEAHSMGTMGQSGRGIGEYWGIDPARVDIWMGTLSKSFASCGGYIAGSQALVKYLKYTVPGFVYSVGISPPNTAAALAALRLLKAEPERVQRLQARARLFLELARANGLNTGSSQHSPIVPIIIGSSKRCMQLSQRLFDQGINVFPIIFPAVPENAARLRFFLSAMHTEAQLRFTVETLARLMNAAS
ncbi:MAG: hypothetical protein Fur0044_01060 [Anaerolineae bacterium]|nr:aminotransferase class I/II-fold pyridoxal phosphate-dependent enzyme [Anaerolineales bacterium]